jgi:hypothetical protein
MRAVWLLGMVGGLAREFDGRCNRYPQDAFPGRHKHKTSRRNTMADGKSTGGVIAIVVIIIVVIAVAFGFLRVRQTQDAKLPEVSVAGGQAPKFDVDAAKVDVGTKQASVPVPKVETKREPITLPTVSVKKPGE